MTTAVIPRGKLNLAIAVTALLKGPVYRDTDATAWAHLRGLSTRVSDHMATFGLSVVVDEAQGFAYLRSLPEEYLDEHQIPRLVPRTRFSRNATVLLVLLRKKLLEFDATDAGTRLILDASVIRDMMSPFMPTGDNEVRAAERIDTAVRTVAKAGFLRALPGQGDQYEVLRIVTALVTADWLAGTGHEFAVVAGRDSDDASETDPVDLDTPAADTADQEPS